MRVNPIVPWLSSGLDGRAFFVAGTLSAEALDCNGARRRCGRTSPMGTHGERSDCLGEAKHRPVQSG